MSRTVRSVVILSAAWMGLALAAPASRAEEPAVPAPNPWAAEGPYPMSHHNPAQTDLTVVEGPTKGKRLERADAKTVPVIWCSGPIVKKVGAHTTAIAGTPHGLVTDRRRRARPSTS